MKVSIGMRLQDGPWGGGNRFGRALAEELSRRGAEVSFNLRDPALDLILLAEPRRNLRISAYNDDDIVRYQWRRNPSAIVVHRINECDERKGTTGVNRRLVRANRCADHTVFVSDWLSELFARQGLKDRPSSVIRNGSNRSIFNSVGYRPWDGVEPLRLVTHHWGANWLKGFDIYSRLDQMLAEDPFREKYHFTYIGNLPPGYRFQHASYQPPISGTELAACLRRHHVYLTASRNEPGSHHQNEGALCGLPLLYIESGCLPEYCAGFGIPFLPEQFEEKLQMMRQSYLHWAARMPDYPHTSERMCAQYYDLIVELMDRRHQILAQRQPRPPLRLVRAYLYSLRPRRAARIVLQWFNRWIGSPN